MRFTQSVLASANLKLAVRSFNKNKSYAITALFVLTLGIFTTAIIVKFIEYELRFDNYHERSEDVYRVILHLNTESGQSAKPLVPAPLATNIRQDIAEVEEIARICKFRAAGSFKIDGETTFNEPNYIWADPELLSILSIEMLHGNPSTALTDPKSLVITESIALKYFATTQALGKVIRFGTNFYEDVELTVTGVVKDLPENSHVQIDLLVSFRTLDDYHYRDIIASWDIDYYYTYLKLYPEQRADLINPKLDQIIHKNVSAEDAAVISLSLQPIKDIYLNPIGEGWVLGPSSDKKYIYFFISIGSLILLMSIINYVNLATAKASGRFREIGMRKTLGADKRQIFWQHMTESLILAMLAMTLALVFSKLTLPILSRVFERSMSLSFQGDWMLLSAMLVLALLIGLVSGFYPSLVMSSFKITEALKAGKNGSPKKLTLRNILVMIQFGASIIVLVATVLVYQQLNYVRNADIGFDQEHLLIVPLGTADVISKRDLFKNQLEALNSVYGFSTASQFVGSNQLFGEDFEFFDAELEESRSVDAVRFEVDHDFLDVLGAQFVSGRNFQRNFSTDLEQAIIVNEAFLKAAQITNPEDALGMDLEVNFNWGETLNLKLVGIVQDFQMQSMRTEIEPAAFYVRPQDASMAHIRISGENVPQTLLDIEKIMKSIAPELGVDFLFQDQQVDAFYKADRQFQQLLYYLVGISVLIAGLGLFSLALYTVEQKQKEIALRKVLGASSYQLANNLLVLFLKLIFVAALIAVPVALFAANQWLNDFAYRIEVSPMVFVVIIALVCLLVTISIGRQLFKVGQIEPAKILRN